MGKTNYSLFESGKCINLDGQPQREKDAILINRLTDTKKHWKKHVVVLHYVQE